MRVRLVAVAALAVIAACQKKGAPPGDVEVARRLAADQRILIEQALADARAKNPSRQVDRGFTSCASVVGVLGRLKASEEAQLALDLEELCGHALPIAELTAAVEAVEGDAAACRANSQVPLAKTALEQAGRLDAEATKLIARYEARCRT
ncbi:MAG TPA: hypothetical protein VFQ53_01475 [Kofleriaceae bacterium]|nr:hypothetical protein [Kofleriaceae bacterium]